MSVMGRLSGVRYEAYYNEALIHDNHLMRAAGNELAIAALEVIKNYDGTHRLALAVSEWAKVVANESGRGKDGDGQ